VGVGSLLFFSDSFSFGAAAVGSSITFDAFGGSWVLSGSCFRVLLTKLRCWPSDGRPTKLVQSIFPSIASISAICRLDPDVGAIGVLPVSSVTSTAAVTSRAISPEDFENPL